MVDIINNIPQSEYDDIQTSQRSCPPVLCHFLQRAKEFQGTSVTHVRTWWSPITVYGTSYSPNRFKTSIGYCDLAMTSTGTLEDRQCLVILSGRNQSDTSMCDKSTNKWEREQTCLVYQRTISVLSCKQACMSFSIGCNPWHRTAGTSPCVHAYFIHRQPFLVRKLD